MPGYRGHIPPSRREQEKEEEEKRLRESGTSRRPIPQAQKPAPPKPVGKADIKAVPDAIRYKAVLAGWKMYEKDQGRKPGLPPVPIITAFARESTYNSPQQFARIFALADIVGYTPGAHGTPEEEARILDELSKWRPTTIQEALSPPEIKRFPLSPYQGKTLHARAVQGEPRDYSEIEDDPSELRLIFPAGFEMPMDERVLEIPELVGFDKKSLSKFIYTVTDNFNRHRGQGNAAMIPDEDLKTASVEALQWRLVELGYFMGPVEGSKIDYDIDKQGRVKKPTSKVIYGNKYVPTGILDQPTRRALRELMIRRALSTALSPNIKDSEKEEAIMFLVSQDYIPGAQEGTGTWQSYESELRNIVARELQIARSKTTETKKGPESGRFNVVEVEPVLGEKMYAEYMWQLYATSDLEGKPLPEIAYEFAKLWGSERLPEGVDEMSRDYQIAQGIGLLASVADFTKSAAEQLQVAPILRSQVSKTAWKYASTAAQDTWTLASKIPILPGAVGVAADVTVGTAVDGISWTWDEVIRNRVPQAIFASERYLYQNWFGPVEDLLLEDDDEATFIGLSGLAAITIAMTNSAFNEDFEGFTESVGETIDRIRDRNYEWRQAEQRGYLMSWRHYERTEDKSSLSLACDEWFEWAGLDPDAHVVFKGLVEVGAETGATFLFDPLISGAAAGRVLNTKAGRAVLKHGLRMNVQRMEYGSVVARHADDPYVLQRIGLPSIPVGQGKVISLPQRVQSAVRTARNSKVPFHDYVVQWAAHKKVPVPKGRLTEKTHPDLFRDWRNGRERWIVDRVLTSEENIPLHMFSLEPTRLAMMENFVAWKTARRPGPIGAWWRKKFTKLIAPGAPIAPEDTPDAIWRLGAAFHWKGKVDGKAIEIAPADWIKAQAGKAAAATSAGERLSIYQATEKAIWEKIEEAPDLLKRYKKYRRYRTGSTPHEQQAQARLYVPSTKGELGQDVTEAALRLDRNQIDDMIRNSVAPHSAFMSRIAIARILSREENSLLRAVMSGDVDAVKATFPGVKARLKARGISQQEAQFNEKEILDSIDDFKKIMHQLDDMPDIFFDQPMPGIDTQLWGNVLPTLDIAAGYTATSGPLARAFETFQGWSPISHRMSIEALNRYYRGIVLAKVSTMWRAVMGDEFLRLAPEGVSPADVWRDLKVIKDLEARGLMSQKTGDAMKFFGDMVAYSGGYMPIGPEDVNYGTVYEWFMKMFARSEVTKTWWQGYQRGGLVEARASLVREVEAQVADDTVEGGVRIGRINSFAKEGDLMRANGGLGKDNPFVAHLDTMQIDKWADNMTEFYASFLPEGMEGGGKLGHSVYVDHMFREGKISHRDLKKVPTEALRLLQAPLRRSIADPKNFLTEACYAIMEGLSTRINKLLFADAFRKNKALLQGHGVEELYAERIALRHAEIQMRKAMYTREAYGLEYQLRNVSFFIPARRQYMAYWGKYSMNHPLKAGWAMAEMEEYTPQVELKGTQETSPEAAGAVVGAMGGLAVGGFGGRKVAPALIGAAVGAGVGAAVGTTFDEDTVPFFGDAKVNFRSMTFFPITMGGGGGKLTDEGENMWLGILSQNQGGPMVTLPVQVWSILDPDGWASKYVINDPVLGEYFFRFAGKGAVTYRPLDQLYYSITGQTLPQPMGKASYYYQKQVLQLAQQEWRRNEGAISMQEIVRDAKRKTKMMTWSDMFMNFFLVASVRHFDPDVEDFTLAKMEYNAATTIEERKKILSEHPLLRRVEAIWGLEKGTPRQKYIDKNQDLIPFYLSFYQPASMAPLNYEEAINQLVTGDRAIKSEEAWAKEIDEVWQESQHRNIERQKREKVQAILDKFDKAARKTAKDRGYTLEAFRETRGYEAYFNEIVMDNQFIKQNVPEGVSPRTYAKERDYEYQVSEAGLKQMKLAEKVMGPTFIWEMFNGFPAYARHVMRKRAERGRLALGVPTKDLNQYTDDDIKTLGGTPDDKTWAAIKMYSTSWDNYDKLVNAGKNKKIKVSEGGKLVERNGFGGWWTPEAKAYKLFIRNGLEKKFGDDPDLKFLLLTPAQKIKKLGYHKADVAPMPMDLQGVGGRKDMKAIKSWKAMNDTYNDIMRIAYTGKVPKNDLMRYANNNEARVLAEYETARKTGQLTPEVKTAYNQVVSGIQKKSSDIGWLNEQMKKLGDTHEDRFQEYTRALAWQQVLKWGQYYHTYLGNYYNKWTKMRGLSPESKTAAPMRKAFKQLIDWAKKLSPAFAREWKALDRWGGMDMDIIDYRM